MDNEDTKLETTNQEPEKFETVYEAHRSQHDWVEGHEADMLMEQLIATSCGAEGYCRSNDKLAKGDMVYSVEYLAENLPAVQFVSQFYLELIIHGGILAKDDYNQKKLDEWMLKKNPYGQANGNVIREALHQSIIYGYSGLRRIFDDIVLVEPNHFKIWSLPKTASGRPIPGIKAPLFYEITNKAQKIERDNEKNVFTVDGQKYTLQEVIKQQRFVKGVDGSYFIDDDADGAEASNVFLPAELFCHLRHSDEGKYGLSPLATDRLRTTLIVDYIRNVIDEVGNDGTDYMMYLKQRGTAGASLTSMFSKTAVENTATAAIDPKLVKQSQDKQLDAARELARKMKRTAKTRMNIINQDWVEKIEKLEGTVRLYEYMSILNDAKGTIADIYGIPAMLAGSSGGGWSTGMSALIPFTIERTIKPFQQRYAAQLSDMIASCAGVKGNISFKEIDWTDIQTQAEIDKVRAQTEELLSRANLNKVSATVAKKTKSLPATTNKSTDK